MTSRALRGWGGNTKNRFMPTIQQLWQNGPILERRELPKFIQEDLVVYLLKVLNSWALKVSLDEFYLTLKEQLTPVPQNLSQNTEEGPLRNLH